MDVPVIEITADTGRKRYAAEVWRARNLIFLFTWRDTAVRYRQTFAGVLWVLLRPLVTMAIFTLVFGKFLKVPSGDTPYALLILSGLLPWQFFAYGFSGVGDSLFRYSSVISKVYFPRIIVPLSAFAGNVIDTLVALMLFVPLMLYYDIAPSWRLLLLPVVFAAAVPASLGLGLWFSALSVRYRDFMHITPFLVMLSLYASPVGFASDVVPKHLQDYYWLNPLVGVINAFRWVLFDVPFEPPVNGLLGSVLLSACLLVFGYLYFRRVERSFVDVI